MKKLAMNTFVLVVIAGFVFGAFMSLYMRNAYYLLFCVPIVMFLS